MELEKYMTSVEFADAIKRKYSTVARWLRDGLIPGAEPQKLGNEIRWFIPRERVGDFKQWSPTKNWGKRGKAKKSAEKTTKKGSTK
jgi:hypothetical protein